MALFLIGLFLFLGLHLFGPLMPHAKAHLMTVLGKAAYRAAFGVAGLASLCLLIYGFGQARLDTGVLYTPPAFLSHITLTLMLFALVILVAGFLPAGHIATKTKHPIVLSIKIWAAAHLLANGDLASVLLFVALLAWGVVLRISYKRRVRSGELVLKPFVSARWDAIAVVGGIVVWAVITMWLHKLLIGVAPLAM